MKNPTFDSRTKHITKKYHFICDILKGELLLEKICGKKNPDDILTKIVFADKKKLCITSIGSKLEALGYVTKGRFLHVDE